MVPDQVQEMYMRVVGQEDKEDEVRVTVAETHVNHSDASSRDDKTWGTLF